MVVSFAPPGRVNATHCKLYVASGQTLHARPRTLARTGRSGDWSLVIFHSGSWITVSVSQWRGVDEQETYRWVVISLVSLGVAGARPPMRMKAFMPVEC